MIKFDEIKHEESKEQVLYKKRENFIKENYPISKSHYQINELINSGLDGMDVLEKRNENGEIEGMISYTINKERNNNPPYLSIGIMLTSEESHNEGIMKDLILELKNIALKNKCEYIAAIADTNEGEEFLLSEKFIEEHDKVNGRDYMRLDL